MRLSRLIFPLLLLSAIGAQAGPLTYDFSGTVTSVFDPDGHYNGHFAVGQTFTGSFTYSVSSTPWNVQGSQQYYSVDQLRVAINGYAFPHETFQAVARVNPHLFQAVNYTDPFPDFITFPNGYGYDVVSIPTSFDNPTDNSIPDPSLVPGHGTLTSTVTSSSGDYSQIVGQINSFSLEGGSAGTPEPASMLLMATALGAFGIARARRRA